MYKAIRKLMVPTTIHMYISLKLLNLYEFIARKQQNIGANTIIPYPINIARGIKASNRNTCKNFLFINLYLYSLIILSFIETISV